MNEELKSLPVSDLSNIHLKIDNKHSMIEFSEGCGIITHLPTPNFIIDLNIILENNAVLSKYTNLTVCPLLLDFTKFTTVNPLYTPTARAVLLGSESKTRQSAIAFLFNDSSQIEKAFLFQTANKFNIPMKMFTHRDEALIWLKTFIPN